MFEAEGKDGWFEQRWSKFTASEDYKLLTSAKPNERWSAGAMTYIEQKAIEFWDLVKRGELPEFDGSTSTYEAVREMHPEIDGSEVEIDGLHHLANAQLAFEEAERALLKEKAEVMQMMGKAQHAYTEVDGVKYRIASRQARGQGKPFLVIHKGKK